MLLRLKKLGVPWKSVNLTLFPGHRRKATTMQECMDSPPQEGYRRVLFIVMSIALVYYVCCHFGGNDLGTDVEIDLSSLQRDEVPCKHDCNFDALSKKMKDKIVETFKHVPDGIPPCDANMLGLEKFELSINITNANLTRDLYPSVTLGGYYTPRHCRARHKVAIIVPYRDQEANLNVFIFNIHPFLMNQDIEYRIFIIEQSGDQKLNKGRLFNAGFEEANQLGSWGCMVFHDVDLLPMDARILYTCPTFPRHMSANVLDHQNDSQYEHFGGVTSLTQEHFLKVNGYSNVFWGCCDISFDMFWRIRLMGLRVVRYDKAIARYMALSISTERNHKNSTHRMPASHKASPLEDGLTTFRYKVLAMQLRELFTHIVVDVNPKTERTE